MAIKKTKTHKEILITDAYHKIHEVRIAPAENGTFSVHFSLELKANTTAPYVCLVRTIDYMFYYDLESTDNVLKQAYDYMKTLEEFDGAVDA